MRVFNYSGFVIISKVICILFAILVVSLTVILSVYGYTSKHVKIDLTTENNIKPKEKFILKPILYSINANKETFSIKAAEAKEQNTETILLKQIEGHLTTNEDKNFNIYSELGHWLQDSRVLELTGNVNLLHDNGIITTDAATLDINKQTVSSDSDTHVVHPSISIKSKGFTFIQQEKKVIFNGPVKTTLFIDQTQ